MNEKKDDVIEMKPMDANDHEQDLAEEETREPLLETDAGCHEPSSDEHQGEEPEQGTEDPKKNTEKIKFELHQEEAKVEIENENDGIAAKSSDEE